MSGETSASTGSPTNGVGKGAASSPKESASKSKGGNSEGTENTPATNKVAEGKTSTSGEPKASKGAKAAKDKGKSVPAKSSGGTKTGSKPKADKEKDDKAKAGKAKDKKGTKSTASREVKVPNREPPKNPPSKKELALADMTYAQRRRVIELEKKEKALVLDMSKSKTALEGMTKKVINIKWPVKDEEVLDKLRLAEEQVKRKKPRSTHLTDEQLQPPLPSPTIPILLTNQGLACDVISCWDFMTVFGEEMELNPMSLDHFTELLQYEGGDSPAFIEVFTAPLRIVLADEALANRLSISMPLEQNFARKETSAETQIAALERSFEKASVATQKLADGQSSHRSGSSGAGSYSPPGFKNRKSQIYMDIRAARRDFKDLIALASRTSLLPRGLTDSLLNEPLEWQEVLAGAFLYLPPVARLLRLNAELLDELTALAAAEAEAQTAAKAKTQAQGQPEADSMDTAESVGMDIDGGESDGEGGQDDGAGGGGAVQRTSSARRKSVLAGDDSDDEDEDLGLNMDNAWVLTGDIRASLTLCAHALRSLTAAELYTASPEAKVFILKALFESCCDTEVFRDLLSSNQAAIQEKRTEMRKDAALKEAKKKEGSKGLRKQAEALCRDENKAKVEAKEAAKAALEERKAEALRKKAEKEKEKEAAAKDKASKDVESKAKGKSKDEKKDEKKGREKEKQDKPKLNVEEAKEDPKTSKSSSSSGSLNSGDGKGGKGEKGKKGGSVSGSGSSEKDPYKPSPQQVDKKLEQLRMLRAHDVDEIRNEAPVEEVSDSEAEAEDEEQEQEGKKKAGAGAKRKKGPSRQETAEREERKKRREQDLADLEDAEYSINEALDSGLEKDLKRAAKDAELSGLVWYSEEEDKRFCVPLMLKVYRALHDIRKAAEKVKAEMEMEETLQEFVVRSEPLGYDRYFNEYYCFKGDRHRLYVRIRSELPSSSLISNSGADGGGGGGGSGRRQDRPQYFSEKLDDNEGLRRLYETRPMKVSNPAIATWGIYGSAREIYNLVESLDERGAREKALKMALKGKYDGITEAPQQYKFNHEWVGRRVKRVFPGSRGLKPAIGIVDGWLPDNEPEEGDEAVWHVKYKDGDEEELDLKEMNKFLIDGPQDNFYFTPPPPLSEAAAAAAAGSTQNKGGSMKASSSSASLDAAGAGGNKDSKVVGAVGDSLAALDHSSNNKSKGSNKKTPASSGGGARYSKPVDVQLYMQRYLDPVDPDEDMDTEDGDGLKGDAVGRSLSGRTIKTTKTYGQELQQQQEEADREKALSSAKIKAQLAARFRDEEPEICATYSNTERGYKHKAASRENIGLSALKTRLHRCVAAVTTGMKREGLQQVFSRDVKSALSTAITAAATAAELSSVVIELEGYIYQIQEGRGAEDVDDQEVAKELQAKNHDTLNKERWLMDPAVSPYIGKLVRCFFSRTGGSNGIVVGYYDRIKESKEKSKDKKSSSSSSSSSSASIVKAEEKDEEEASGPSETAQYMIEHEDGEMEVMTEKTLLKNIHNFEEYMAKMETEAHLFSFFEDADIDPEEAKSYADELHTQTSSHVWAIKHRIVASAASRTSKAAAAAMKNAAKAESKGKGKGKGSSKSRKRARDEEETESEDGSQADETTETLWPSKGVRERWQGAARASKTVAAVALSFSTFVVNAAAFNALDEDEIYS